EIGRGTGGGERRDGDRADPGQRRRFRGQSGEEVVHRRRRSLHLHPHAGAVVADLPGESELRGQRVDERAEPDSLHGAGDLGPDPYRRTILHVRIIRFLRGGWPDLSRPHPQAGGDATGWGCVLPARRGAAPPEHQRRWGSSLRTSRILPLGPGVMASTTRIDTSNSDAAAAIACSAWAATSADAAPRAGTSSTSTWPIWRWTSWYCRIPDAVTRKLDRWLPLRARPSRA